MPQGYERAEGKQMTGTDAVADGTIVQRVAGKIAAEMGDETVILDIVSGNYFQLNRSGARLWELIESPIAFAALCDKVMAAFDIDGTTCRADVTEFVQTMRGQGLVDVS